MIADMERARVDAERYTYILADARSRMRGIFTPDEVCAIYRAANGTLFEPHTLRGILWNLEDMTAEEAGLDAKTRERLLEKLQNLSLVEHAALVDMVEKCGPNEAVDLIK